jgi:hypothetical protein
MRRLQSGFRYCALGLTLTLPWLAATVARGDAAKARSNPIITEGALCSEVTKDLSEARKQIQGLKKTLLDKEKEVANLQSSLQVERARNGLARQRTLDILAHGRKAVAAVDALKSTPRSVTASPSFISLDVAIREIVKLASEGGPSSGGGASGSSGSSGGATPADVLGRSSF